MNITRLPAEIVSIIFLYLQNPEAKLIADEINFYEKDKYYEKYYMPFCPNQEGPLHTIKNYMSFSKYFLHLRRKPSEYRIKKKYIMQAAIIGVSLISFPDEYL